MPLQRGGHDDATDIEDHSVFIQMEAVPCRSGRLRSPAATTALSVLLWKQPCNIPSRAFRAFRTTLMSTADDGPPSPNDGRVPLEYKTHFKVSSSLCLSCVCAVPNDLVPFTKGAQGRRDTIRRVRTNAEV